MVISNYLPFIGCAVIVSIYVLAAIIIVIRFERLSRPRGKQPHAYMGILAIGNFSREDLWKCCGGALHPGWLLGFRLLALLYLFPQVAYNFYVDGLWMFYFYTQWTFTLLIGYFAVASWISGVHCLKLWRGTSSGTPEEELKLTSTDGEGATDSSSGDLTNVNPQKQAVTSGEKINPGYLDYAMQISFQIMATAVLMTDFVYWFLLVPFVLPPDHRHSFLDVNMHAVNAIFVVIESSLNSMYYPWFRGAYVVFWSATYIIFQWTLHAVGFKGWPYPFLSLSTLWAPAWYAGLSLFHLACFVVCMLFVNVKQHVIHRKALQPTERLATTASIV